MFDFEEFSGTIEEVAERGISADGELEGFQEIVYAGHDIEEAVQDADLVFAVGPAYSTMPFAEVCAPYVRRGRSVVCPSSCAGDRVQTGARSGTRRRLGAHRETSTLPYAVRLTGPAHITVYNRLKGGYYVAALPVDRSRCSMWCSPFMARSRWPTTCCRPLCRTATRDPSGSVLVQRR